LILALASLSATMEPLVKARQEKGNTLNAVDDLKSYARIADVHAAGAEQVYSGL
jgi:hypothetical protein